MALLGNYSVLNKSPGRHFSGGATSLGQFRADFNKSGANPNIFAGWAGVDKKTSFPQGYSLGYPIRAPQKSGGMGVSPNRLVGTGGVTSGNLAGGLNGEAALTGSGDITNAALGLIVSAVASLVGAGDITSANLVAILNGVAALVGTGDVTAAPLTGKGNFGAALTGTGEPTADITAKAAASSDIVVTGDLLTTANVADAILDALNGIEDGLTPRQAIRLITAALAGKVSGGGTSTVVFRNAVADDTDRITATVDNDGNRTAITYDAD